MKIETNRTKFKLQKLSSLKVIIIMKRDEPRIFDKITPIYYCRILISMVLAITTTWMRYIFVNSKELENGRRLETKLLATARNSADYLFSVHVYIVFTFEFKIFSSMKFLIWLCERGSETV